MKEINFNDLSNFSTLPETISNSSDEDIKYKTKDEVLREFDREKWLQILDEIKKDESLTLKDIDCKIEEFEKSFPFFYKNKFYLGSGKQIFQKHIQIFKNALDPYIENASSLVELGAGYGSKILNLSNYKNYNKLPLYAGEFTKNGCEAIKLLSQRMNKEIEVGYCDLKEEIINGIKVPKNSIIFTSYAAHYIENLSTTFIDFILKMDPKIIINFEPCYENHSDTKYGLMCQRYIELNGYNLNMISVLEEANQNGKINLKISENIIGSNPFLPISIIKWHKSK